eukprot:UN27778
MIHLMTVHQQQKTEGGRRGTTGGFFGGFNTKGFLLEDKTAVFSLLRKNLHIYGGTATDREKEEALELERQRSGSHDEDDKHRRDVIERGRSNVKSWEKSQLSLSGVESLTPAAYQNDPGYVTPISRGFSSQGGLNVPYGRHLSSPNMARNNTLDPRNISVSPPPQRRRQTLPP